MGRSPTGGWPWWFSDRARRGWASGWFRQRGWLPSWSCPRRQGPRDWEEAEAGAEVGSGGVRSSDILRGRPLGDWLAPGGARQEPRASEVGPGVLPGSVAAGWRAPPGGAPPHCPELSANPLLSSLRSQGETLQRHQGDRRTCPP